MKINNCLKYTFINKKTGETFVGTRRDFTIKYKLNAHRVFLLIQGEGKSHNNWTLQQQKQPQKQPKKQPQNVHKFTDIDYTFRNKNTNEEFVGNILDFSHQYRLNPYTVLKVVKNKRKSVKGWLIPEHIDKPVMWWEHKNRDTTIYKFRNKNTSEEFVGERCAFYRKFNLDNGAVSHLIKGNRPQHKGWILLEKEKPNE